MIAFGVTDFRPPDWMAEEDDPEEFGILPENWDAVNAFLACGTQWRQDRNGKPQGMRYEGVETVLRRRCIAMMDDAFARIQIMETAAVREFAKTPQA